MNEQDERVKTHFDSMKLPPERLEQLLKLSDDNSQKVYRFSKPEQSLSALTNLFGRPWIRGAVALSLMLLISVWMHTTGTHSERADRTFREVAMNHTTRLNLEYQGESLAQLDDSMQQLPFTLVLPDTVDNEYRLVGSRYCSLAGNLAAHIKFKDRGSGKPVSLFVTGHAAELQGISAQKTTMEGVDVEFWQEGGLFFALARQS